MSASHFSLKTPICDLLSIDVPIVQAAMGSRGQCTPPALVAAVCEAGAMGVFGTSNLPPDEIRDHIREIQKLTQRPFGVNAVLPATLAAEAGPTRTAVRQQIAERYPDHMAFMKSLMAKHDVPPFEVEDDVVFSPEIIKQQVQVILDSGAKVFSAGLGPPDWVVPEARKRDMLVMGTGGSVGNCLRHQRSGVDVVLCQGYEGGGHTGWLANFPLIPQVVDAVSPTPILAGGGIADGRGVAAALALGAAGVWVGTAFLVAEECGIAEEKKQQILNGRSQDFGIARAFTGQTLRAFRNDVVEAWEASGLDPLPMPYQKVLTDDFNESVERAGKNALHMNPAGQIAGMLTESKPAVQIVLDIVEETVEVLGKLQAVVTTR